MKLSQVDEIKRKGSKNMLTVEKLREYGADVDDGLKRCMGSEDLYLRLVNKILSEETFDKLQKSLEEKDLDAAFEAAHALKGVVGNLSLTPLAEKISEITELLRSRTDMDYSEILNEILSLKTKLENLSK